MKLNFILCMLCFLFALESQGTELFINVGVLDPYIYGELTSMASSSQDEGNLEMTAIIRILDIQGIPYEIIEQHQELLDYKLIITAGSLENPNVSQELMNHLLDYVELGGTVLSAGGVGSKLFSLYGVKQHLPSKKRYRLNFRGDDPSFYYMDRPEEKTISLGNGEAHFYDEVIWSHGYILKSSTTLLGTFEDNNAGFLVNSYGRGKAYLLGMSFVESVMLPQRNGDFEAQRGFVNSFEPSADVIMLILKAIYQKVYSTSVVLSVIPQGRPNALLLTHDVDAQTSFVDSLKFLQLEEQYNAIGTYFITTKTFTDSYDIGYYNIKENVDALRELDRRGADIASHSVSHYVHFSQSSLGNSRVNVSNYNPLQEITIYGELKVSKEILDRDIPGLNTVSFRSGYLEFPNQLIEALEESGYLYDSSFSANDTLTAFPSIALERQDLGSRESRIIEIPVTMDDALDFLMPASVDQAVNQWKDLCDANGNNGAINVLLIHPSDTRRDDYKLRAQERLMNHISEQQGWMGNITDFGDYWIKRQSISYRLYIDGLGRLVIELNQPSQQLHPWISFELMGQIPDDIILLDSNRENLDYKSIRRRDKLFISF
jgi:peptidoglycan/xylan/chitin deacetylase (PgdA/CDA1 family)